MGDLLVLASVVDWASILTRVVTAAPALSATWLSTCLALPVLCGGSAGARPVTMSWPVLAVLYIGVARR